MKNFKISIFVALLFPFFNNAFSQVNWLIKNAENTKTPIILGDKITGGKYVLKNTTKEFTDEKYREIVSAILKYGKRDWGMNIVWGTMAEKLNETNYINILRKPGYSVALKNW